MSNETEILVGAVEAGGTKFVCAVGTGPHDRILAKNSFPTGDDPERLLATISDWFRLQELKHGTIQALGIASFGPVDLRPESSTYGHITSTPKSGWRNTDLVGLLRRSFRDVPIGLDTDVNGAALGEFCWGSAVGLTDFVYITIGTGIGAGGMSGGRLLHGLVHPEMGHMMLPREPGDRFDGICPFHGACWEGLCSGLAMFKRSGVPAEDLPEDHPDWSIEAHYIASAIANITYVLSPQRVVIGGSLRKAGKLGQEKFLASIRSRLRQILNDYITSSLTREDIASYVVPPSLGDDAGICGAIALAHRQSPNWR